MSTLPQVRASRVLPDTVSSVPGLETGTYPVAAAPIFFHSGLLDCVAAVTEQAPHYIVAPLKVVAVKIRVRTQLGTGAALVRVGKIGDADWISETSIAIAGVAGTVATATILNSGLLAVGDVLYFSADGGATTTGDVDVTVVAVPI